MHAKLTIPVSLLMVASSLLQASAFQPQGRSANALRPSALMAQASAKQADRAKQAGIPHQPAWLSTQEVNAKDSQQAGIPHQPAWLSTTSIPKGYERLGTGSAGPSYTTQAKELAAFVPSGHAPKTTIHHLFEIVIRSGLYGYANELPASVEILSMAEPNAKGGLQRHFAAKGYKFKLVYQAPSKQHPEKMVFVLRHYGGGASGGSLRYWVFLIGKKTKLEQIDIIDANSVDPPPDWKSY